MIMKVFKCVTIADAFERSVREILNNGYPRMTENGEYTLEVPELAFEIADPFLEPRVSKLSPHSRLYMDEYSRQVLEGTNGNFDYDYHERLFKWGSNRVCTLLQGGNSFLTAETSIRQTSIDQVKYIIDTLCDQLTSRRGIANTWIPGVDIKGQDVPCLQSFFCVVRPPRSEKGPHRVDCTVTFRSNDMLMASNNNMYAMTNLQRYITERVAQQHHVVVGTYTHISFVPHVYVKRDADQIEKRWLKNV